MYGVPGKMTENLSESSESLSQSDSACFDASQSYGLERRALNVKVVGRGYLGTIISRALSGSPPVSLSSETRLEGRNQTVVIASGPSSVSVTEIELEKWRGHLERWLKTHRKQRTNSKIIYLSSAGTVYGECGSTEIDENCDLNPANAYGNYHCWAEDEFRNLYGDQVTILRLSNLYGPKQLKKKTQGLVTACIRAVINNDHLPLYGNDSAIRDYIFEEDLVSIVEKIARNETGGVYNVASGISYSIKEIIEMVEDCTNARIRLSHFPGRSQDIRCVRLSNKKLLSKLCIESMTSLRDGIKSYGVMK